MSNPNAIRWFHEGGYKMGYVGERESQRLRYRIDRTRRGGMFALEALGGNGWQVLASSSLLQLLKREAERHAEVGVYAS